MIIILGIKIINISLKKIFKINHKICIIISLTKQYLSQHGGIRHGLPRLIKKSFTIFSQQGFKGIINKLRAMKRNQKQKKFMI